MDVFTALRAQMEALWPWILASQGLCLGLLCLSFYRRHSIREQTTASTTELKWEKPQLPVLIVGAGPTGLTLALVLARYGIPTRIVEQKAHLSRYSKATNLMQRNQELVAALGLLEPLNQISGQMRRLMVHAYGKSFGPRTMRLKETPFTDVVLCGQHNFERVMADGLTEAGVHVEFGTTLIEVSQNAKAVTATLETVEGTETAEFSYVVGCDGFAGTTRKFTSVDFETVQTGVAIRQLDCKLQWRRLSDMEQMWLFYFDHGFAVVVPLPGGVHRVLCIEPRPSFPERNPTLEEMQSKLRDVANDQTVVLSEPEWFSYTDLSMGLAPSLQDRRIILAGDSGNPVLPNGGQGMNTGIADAFNLGWKLAAVYRYGAPQALLQTYTTERHAVRAALQSAQFNSLKYTTLVTPKVVQAAFRWFAEPLLGLGGEYAMAQAFSELTIHTRGSPLTLDADKNFFSKGVRAGDRALNAAVVQAYRSTNLYKFIYRGAWTLLAFSGREPYSTTSSLRHSLTQLARPDLATFVVTTDSAETPTSSTLFDLDEEAHRVYGLTHAALFLIRPDGHVGARSRPDQVRLLRQYLDRWIPDASQLFHADRIS